MIKYPFTEGPWFGPHFAEDDTKCSCKCGYIFSEHQRGMGAIAEVYYDRGDEMGEENEDLETAKANARLIRQAPEMFKFLHMLYERMTPASSSIFQTLVDADERAILRGMIDLVLKRD